MTCCGACSGARALNVGATSLAGGRFLATTFGRQPALPMAYDQPSNAGGFFLRPTLLREIAAN